MLRKNLSKRFTALFILVCIISFGLFSFVKTNSNYKEIYYVMADNAVIQKVDAPKVNEVLELRTYYNNSDIVGKLVIEGTNISEPILKGYDNNYYLNHNPYGEYQAEGSVYEDYRTNFGERKALIFGHSSPGWDVPFNELENYYDRAFYDSHKYIKVITEDKTYQYEIFSVYVETSDFTYMNLMIDDETYQSHLKRYQDMSFYKTDITVSENDHILILQTCSNKAEYASYKKKYLLVIAKEIREVM